MSIPSLTIENWNQAIGDIITDLKKVEPTNDQIFSILRRALPLIANYSYLIKQDKHNFVAELRNYCILVLDSTLASFVSHAKYTEIVHIYQSILISFYYPDTLIETASQNSPLGSQSQKILLPTALCAPYFSFEYRQHLWAPFPQSPQTYYDDLLKLFSDGIQFQPLLSNICIFSEFLDKFTDWSLSGEMCRINYCFSTQQTPLAGVLLTQLFSSTSPEEFHACFRQEPEYCKRLHPFLCLNIANYGSLSNCYLTEVGYASLVYSKISQNPGPWAYPEDLFYCLNFQVMQTHAGLCDLLTKQIIFFLQKYPARLKDLPKDLTLNFMSFYGVDLCLIQKLMPRKLLFTQWSFTEESFSNFALFNTASLSFLACQFSTDWLRYLNPSLKILVLETMSFPDPQCFRFEMLGSLTSLTLSQVNLDISLSLGDISSFPLKNLCLKQVPCKKGSDLVKFTQLQTLHLEKVPIKKLAKCLPASLTALHVRNDDSIGPEFLSTLQLQQNPESLLKKITVIQTCITFENVPKGLSFEVSGENWTVSPLVDSIPTSKEQL